MFYFGRFQKGQMPDAGAVNDQAAKGIRLFALAAAIVGDCERALMDKTRTKGNPNVRQ